MTNKTYKEWIKEVWTEAGGLITQTMAAKIIGTTRQAIIKKVKTNKIKSWSFDDKESPLISFTEAINAKRERNKKIK